MLGYFFCSRALAACQIYKLAYGKDGLCFAHPCESRISQWKLCRCSPGSRNAVPHNQYGEQTYIRYRISKDRLVGLTLSPNQVSGPSSTIFATRFPSSWIKCVTMVHHLRLLQTQNVNVMRRVGAGQCRTEDHGKIKDRRSNGIFIH